LSQKKLPERLKDQRLEHGEHNDIVDENGTVAKHAGSGLDQAGEPSGSHLNSPSRQLDEESEAAVVASKQSSVAPSVSASHPPPDAPQAHLTGAEETSYIPATQPEHGAAPVTANGSQEASQDATPKAAKIGGSSFLGESSALSEEASMIPETQFSPASLNPAELSPGSGRQPDPDLNSSLDASFTRLEEPADEDDDSGPRESKPRPEVDTNIKTTTANDEKKTPQKPGIVNPMGQSSHAVSISPLSADSFPPVSSLSSQLFLSAKSSRAAQSPAASKTRKSSAAPDLEYEEAMRRIDNPTDYSDEEANVTNQGAGDSLLAKSHQARAGNSTAQQGATNPSPQMQRDVTTSSLAKKLLEKPIGKPTGRAAKLSKNAERPGSPSNRTYGNTQPETARSAASQSLSLGETVKIKAEHQPFTVPENSQVVSLLSSSEDDVDNTRQKADGTGSSARRSTVNKRSASRGYAAASGAGSQRLGLVRTRSVSKKISGVAS
jgi:hypothetical protein